MSDDYFPRTTYWVISRGLVEGTMVELARYGREGREGIVFWLGRRDGETAHITHAVFARGGGVTSTRNLLEVSAELLNGVGTLCDELELVWVGQAHSHGGRWTGMSLPDRTLGATSPYFLSVIVPFFANDRRTTIADCGVHLMDPAAGWRTLTREEIANAITVDPNGSAMVLTVGEEVAR